MTLFATGPLLLHTIWPLDHESGEDIVTESRRFRVFVKVALPEEWSGDAFEVK
jgi:hypothetical protein